MNEENKNLIEEIGKRFDEKTEEVKKHMSVLIEDMNNKIGLLAEGQNVLREKVDELAEDVKTVKQDIEYLKEDMDYVKSNLVDKTDRFKEVEKVADDHEKRLIKLEKTALAAA